MTDTVTRLLVSGSTPSRRFASNAKASADAAAANAATTAPILATPVSAGDALPFEVTALSGSFVGTGTGGTPGEYALVVTGGPAGHTAFITIGGDGKIASARIDKRGISTANTAPTYALPSGTGLTGATLPTATVSALTEGRVFLAPNASSNATVNLGWQSASGVVAEWVVSGAQWSEYNKTGVDVAVSAALGGLPNYASAAEGLADTSDGDQFQVVQDGGTTYSIAYSNDGGSAVEVNRVPAKAALDAIPTVTDFTDIQTAVDAITADPANAVTSIFVPAQMLERIVNTNASYVSGTSATRLPYWQMPRGAVPPATGTSSYVELLFQCPSHWSTMYVDFYLISISGGSGNVRMLAEMHNWALGETINVNPSGNSGAVTQAASTTALITFKARTAAITCDPTKFGTLRMSRAGGSALDTLASDVGIIAVALVKAS